MSKINPIIPLGVDDKGQAQYLDFSKQRNLIMGGTTGSGKSNFAHSLILSLMTQYSTSEVKLLLIDMKRVELTAYNGSPYLLTDCIVDSDVAVKWLGKVLEDKKVDQTTSQATFIFIDTFSDLMASDQKDKFITLIKEIANDGSKLGIHLVMSDSRVGEEIFIPLFLSEIETHICFNVVDKTASQLLINTDDGISLDVGKAIITQNKKNPIRIKTPYVTDQEIEEHKLR